MTCSQWCCGTTAGASCFSFTVQKALSLVQHICRLYESVRVVSVSMGQGLGLGAVSEARASACVSIYSLMCATLPSRTVMSKTHSSLYGLFVA